MARFALWQLKFNFSADWRVARSFGEAEEQRDALREKAWLAAFGMYPKLEMLWFLRAYKTKGFASFIKNNFIIRWEIKAYTPKWLTFEMLLLN